MFFGKNGSGKSNILRAAQFGVKALKKGATESPNGFGDKSRAVVLGRAGLNDELGFRPGDFHRGGTGRAEVSLTMAFSAEQLAEWAAPIWLRENALTMKLVVAVQLTQLTDGFASLLVERAQWMGAFGPRALLTDEFPPSVDLVELAILRDPSKRVSQGGVPMAPVRANALQEAENRAQKELEDWRRFENRLVRELLPNCFNQVDAYRLPSRIVGESAEKRLHESFVSEQAGVTESIRRLKALLGRALGLGEVEVRPVKPDRLHVSRPGIGEMALEQLGTGEEQLILLLASVSLGARAIVMVEEPEAHLHISLMRSLGSALRDEVVVSKSIDQLWIATHHHLFALHQDYFDVRLENGETLVERRPRSLAAEHFYEPGAVWDAFRLLRADGLSSDSVIYKTRSGRQVTAKELEDSEQGDRVLFNEWVADTTAFVVAQLRKLAREG